MAEILSPSTNKLHAMGWLHNVHRSVLADANTAHDWCIWPDVASLFIGGTNNGNRPLTCPGIFRPREIRDNGSLTARSSDEESTIYRRADRSHIARG